MPDQDDTPRGKYIRALHAMHHDLRSGTPHRVADARGKLAKLRHGLVDGRQARAYEVVFSTGVPSRTEQDAWVLVGGLFATHPTVWESRSGPRSIGASMGALARKSPNADTVARHFTQLLGRDARSLPHHLRQAVRLLATRDIPVHYGRLLDDLTTLLGPHSHGDRAAAIRLTWAREYYQRPATDDQETTP